MHLIKMKTLWNLSSLVPDSTSLPESSLVFEDVLLYFLTFDILHFMLFSYFTASQPCWLLYFFTWVITSYPWESPINHQQKTQNSVSPIQSGSFFPDSFNRIFYKQIKLNILKTELIAIFTLTFQLSKFEATDSSSHCEELQFYLPLDHIRAQAHGHFL